MADLSEIIHSWAAGREGVSPFKISDVEFDFDEGWPGTDVTPGDMPEIVIKYRVHRDVIYKREVSELGDFIQELAISVANRGTIVAEPEPDEIRAALVNLYNAIEGSDKKKLSKAIRDAHRAAQRALEVA